MNVSYVPNAPKPPTVKAFDSSSVTLQWELPADAAYLEPITSYSLYKRLSGPQYSSDPFTLITAVDQIGQTVLEYKVTGLAFGTPYQFIMTASTGVGASNFSGPLIASTGPELATAPGAPTVFGTASSTYLTLQYAAPSSTGNTPILNYKVYTNDIAGAGTFDSGQLVDASGKGTIRNLKTATYYTFKVSAINVIGEGPLSAASAMISTKDERECNVTMRFYPNADVVNHPVGYGLPSNYKTLIEHDIARSIRIPKLRIDVTRIDGRYFDFWIRSVGGLSDVSVVQAKSRLQMQVIDKTSVLHQGVMTYQTDTHYLQFDGRPADLAAARQVKGGPSQRLDTWFGVISGTVVFVVLPTVYALKTAMDEAADKELRDSLYKDKYSENVDTG